MRRFCRLAVLLAAAGCGSSLAPAPPQPAPGAAAVAPGPTPPPERTESALPSQLRTSEAVSRDGMVVTGNPAASRAAVRILESGGNAVDAAVAAAFAMGVAEPGSSGLGGQTDILVRLADGKAIAIDGSARVPLTVSALELQAMREDIRATGWSAYLQGPKAVATPGSLAALDAALRAFGTMTLAEVIEPSIAIAEAGSRWSGALRAFLVHYTAKVRASPYLSRVLLREDLDVWGPDHVYCNPDMACFLRRLSAVGADDFYRGAIATELEHQMREAGGWMRRTDLAQIRAQFLEPVRGSYRGLEVLSYPFPGGGATLVETLGILDRFDAERLRAGDVDASHLLVEASRLAYADAFPRRRPQRLPDQTAIDPAHLDRRAALIRLDRALTDAEANPAGTSPHEVGGTTQISVADRMGNVVSLTQTLGGTFGGGATAGNFGFALNNLLEGFDFVDRFDWMYVHPGQAPMTAMAPTIVVKDGRPLLVLGGAGSARIPPSLTAVVVGVVDRHQPLCEAIEAPRVLWGGPDGKLYAEIAEPVTVALVDELDRRGFHEQRRLAYPAEPVDPTDFGGVNAIYIDPADGTLVGVGDTRRQGHAQGISLPAPPPEPLFLPPCWRTLYARHAPPAEVPPR
jgi:gamma-glutamyltranspeptidase/glutathione hydrolase